MSKTDLTAAAGVGLSVEPRLATLRPDAASADTMGFVARRHASLAAVAPLWRTMQATGASTAYQHIDWVERLIAHLAGPKQAEPILIEVCEARGGAPVMLVPLALVRDRGCRTVTWLDLGVCDYAAPLLMPGRDLSPEQMSAAWRAVRAALPPFDLLWISRIPAEVQGRPNPVALLPGCRRMVMEASGVAIDGDPATVIERICRPSVRRDMGKLRRRLERMGQVAFVEARDPETVDALFHALVAQRRSRFGAMGRFDLLSEPGVEAFYHDSARAGLAGGPARLFGLSLEGVWIACAYGLVHGDRFHGLLLTMADGPWRNTSPGIHIVAELLSWARGVGVTYFDFTVGALSYKKDFGVEARPLDALVEAASLRGATVLAVGRLGEAAMAWLGAHPKWYAGLRAVRRWGRRAAFRREPA